MCRCFIFLLWLLAGPSAWSELSFGKPEWGFGGAVIDGTFNVLTIEVRNTGAQPFEGNLMLDGGSRFSTRASIPYVQPVFIAPGAARVVQFYPYSEHLQGEGRLRWKEQGGGEISIDVPSGGAPCTVLLADLDGASLRNVRLRAFNEKNFPPTVSATDGLQAVVLDHQPRWDPARREAFLGWLRRGGLVHLLRGPDGAMPTFTDDLAVLNVSEVQASVGAGLIVKHDISVAEAAPDFFAKAGFPDPDSGSSKLGYSHRYNSVDHEVFRRLSTVTKPKIAWGLIYTLTFIYVGLVGPVFYFLRRRDYRYVLGGFVGTVALFAWAFTVVGRRGYGERQIHHSVALARAIGDGKWDVRHWMLPFATSGGTYRFRYPGPGHLFAPPAIDDVSGGEIMQGRDAAFVADIPLFSSRPFIHQGVLDGPRLDWDCRGVPAAALVKGRDVWFARLKATGVRSEDIRGVIAQHGTSFFSLDRRNEVWAQTSGSSSPREVFNDREHWRLDETPAGAIEQLSVPSRALASLIAGDTDSQRRALARPLGPKQIRFYTYAAAPQAFPLEAAGFQAGHSFVLFVQEITPAEPAPNP